MGRGLYVKPADVQPINLDIFTINLIHEIKEEKIIIEQREKTIENTDYNNLKETLKSENHMEENISLKRYIQTTGMGTFVDLFPFISKDPEVTVLDLTRLFPEFSKYAATSQSTKLANAKAIFKHNWEIEALKIIADSYRVGPVVRLRAKELLAEFN